jgi:hypothetical protein
MKTESMWSRWCRERDAAGLDHDPVERARSRLMSVSMESDIRGQVGLPSTQPSTLFDTRLVDATSATSVDMVPH